MRRWTLILCLVLGSLAQPACLASPQRPVPPPSEVAERVAQPLSAGLSEQYAQREQRARAQQEFAGGRRRGGVATSTIVIILLVAILVVLIV